MQYWFRIILLCAMRQAVRQDTAAAAASHTFLFHSCSMGLLYYLITLFIIQTSHFLKAAHWIYCRWNFSNHLKCMRNVCYYSLFCARARILPKIVQQGVSPLCSRVRSKYFQCRQIHRYSVCMDQRADNFPLSLCFGTSAYTVFVFVLHSLYFRFRYERASRGCPLISHTIETTHDAMTAKWGDHSHSTPIRNKGSTISFTLKFGMMA